jgi:hypothetical protein
MDPITAALMAALAAGATQVGKSAVGGCSFTSIFRIITIGKRTPM